MVERLEKVLNCLSLDFISTALSSFHCPHQDSESLDVESFLKKHAVDYEKTGEARTYLLLNDDALSQEQVIIDGYFSIALKTLYFNNEFSRLISESVYGNDSKSRPAYLVAQVGRNENAPKGTGGLLIETALEYISQASDIVGGRIAYLDCVPSLRNYYEEKGFNYLQGKHNSGLVQMYRIL